MKRVALVVALLLVGAACTRDTHNSASVQVADPGRCAPVDVAAAPDVAQLLKRLASQYNGSSAARLSKSTCAFVRVMPIESSDARAQLDSGWHNTDRFGPPPALWAPPSGAWLALVNARRGASGLSPIAPTATALAHTPVVIAMPQTMASALDWPAKPVGWADLARLASQPDGWAAYGHPEWDAFRFGKANPTWSTPALLATIAVARLGDARISRSLEASVIYYGDSSSKFLDTWNRLDHDKKNPLSYASAVVADRRSVDAYNSGRVISTTSPTTTTRPKPHTPLVGITPKEGALENDYPLAPLDASWVTPAARNGAASFVAFLRTSDAQREVVKAGFEKGGDPVDVSAPAYRAAPAALDTWSTIRKRARVLLLFDVSDSMGDPADSRLDKSPSKIERAKSALLASLSQLAPDDEVGLRIFTTDVNHQKGRNWADVVPIGRLDQTRAALVREISALQPQNGSPLYAATRGAFDTMAAQQDAARINGVVLMTDGYNEYDKDNDLEALLAHLHSPVRVVTIAYSSQADTVTLRSIARATNANTYPTPDTRSIAGSYPAALANF